MLSVLLLGNFAAQYHSRVNIMGYFNRKIINWTLFLQVFFTTLVPNYIIVSYSVPPMMELNKEFLNWIGIPYNNLAFTIIFILCIFIIPFIIHNIKWFNVDSKYKEENTFLKKLMFGINTVVDSKKNRFHKSKNKNINNSGEFFQDITQPEMQIANICTAITNLLKGYTEDERIKVSLITCRDNQFISYLFISDETSSTEITDLNTHDTTAKQSMRKQKMIVIENVDKKTKKASFWKAGNSQIKSIITYPICCGGKTVFVLCVTSKQEQTFKNSDEKIYQFIFDEFGRRLESYLLEIRTKCQDIQ